MPTFPLPTSPGARVDAGDDVLAAAAALPTKPIAARLARFKAAHAAYSAAEGAATRAEAALGAQQEKVGDADVVQDEAVLALASALAGAGLARTNPFKPLGFAAPSTITVLGYAKEAKEVLRLAKVVRGKKALATAHGKAAAAAKAATKVQRTLAPIKKLEKKAGTARARRDALAQPWATAFAALKRGARAAEDDGAVGLYAALFVRPAGRDGTARDESPPAPPATPPG